MTLTEQILHLWRIGLDSIDIAARTGVSEAWVCRVIARAQDARVGARQQQGRSA